MPCQLHRRGRTLDTRALANSRVWRGRALHQVTRRVDEGPPPPSSAMATPKMWGSWRQPCLRGRRKDSHASTDSLSLCSCLLRRPHGHATTAFALSEAKRLTENAMCLSSGKLPVMAMKSIETTPPTTERLLLATIEMRWPQPSPAHIVRNKIV